MPPPKKRSRFLTAVVIFAVVVAGTLVALWLADRSPTLVQGLGIKR